MADCLSRPANAVTVDLCDLPAIASLQENDEEIQEYEENLKPYEVKENVQIWCDTSTPYPRPFIPKSARFSIFSSLHDFAHPGVKASLSLIKSRYFWPGMDRNIREFVRTCLTCQQSKIVKHTKSPIMHFSIPSDRFETVHIDIVGPLPPCKAEDNVYLSPFKYILTCIDRTTRWIEATPLVEITARSVAIAFFQCWISRFGVPLHVITDRGSQFESELFQELARLVGFHRLRTTSYHPQTNGMVERMHRTLKTSIIARKQEWLLALPIALLGIRASLNESNLSPFRMITGADMLLPLPILQDVTDSEEYTSETIKQLSKEMAKFKFSDFSDGHHHGIKKSYLPKDLESCTHVWLRIDRVRRPLEAPYSGPYKVVSCHKKHMVIELRNGETQTVSLDRVKPVHGPVNKSTPKKLDNAKLTVKPPQPQQDQSDQRQSDVSCDNKVPSVTRSGRVVRFKTTNDYHYY